MSQTQLDIPWLVIIATITLLMFTLCVISLFMRYQKRHNQFISEKRILELDFKQALLQTQLEIQEQTLNTIAQEIHDNIGQTLGFVKINLNNMLLKDPQNNKLEATKDQLTKGINDLRALTRSLHGGRIADLGLADALAQEMLTLQNTGAFTTQLQTTGKLYRLEAQQEMVLFRIVQEALHNAIKHSGASNLTVTLDYEPHQFQLTVTDNGKGFDPAALDAAQKGVGLISMRNRATLIGAQFDITTADGKGTTITIHLSI